MNIAKMHILLLLLIPSASYSAPLECNVGPIQKSYGGNTWDVYACSDKKNIVVVSAPGNPAMPFYFTIFIKNGGYVLNGEGTGTKSATKSAYEELSKLTAEEIQSIISQAINVGK